MFTCIDCNLKRRNDEKSYTSNKGSSCRSCVNSLPKWADFLNAIWNPHNTKREEIEN